MSNKVNEFSSQNFFEGEYSDLKRSISEWVLGKESHVELLRDDSFVLYFQLWIDNYNKKANKRTPSHNHSFIKIIFKNCFENKEKEEDEKYWKKVLDHWKVLKEEENYKINTFDLRKSFFKYYTNINTIQKEEDEDDKTETNPNSSDGFTENFLKKEVATSFDNHLINEILHIKDKVNMDLKVFSFSNKNFGNPLNEDQLMALFHSHRKDILNIQGPPGTGKTTLLKDLVTSLYLNNKTMVIASTNNRAADNAKRVVTEDDILKKLPIIRLGNKKNAPFIYNELINKSKNMIFPELPQELPEDISQSLNEMNGLIHMRKQLNKEINFFNNVFLKKDVDNIKLYKEALTNEFFMKKWLSIFKEFINLKNSKNLFKKIYFYFWRYKIKKRIRNDIYVKKLSSLEFDNNIESFFDKLSTWNSLLNIESKKLSIDEIGKEIKTLKEKIALSTDSVQKAISNKNKAHWDNITKKFLPEIKRLMRIQQTSNNQNKVDEESLFKEVLKNQKRSGNNTLLDYFPIIFSTTLSVHPFINENSMDYLIIDEAAQTSIYSIIGILKYFKNVILLGDTAQLSTVVNTDKKAEEKVFKETHLPEVYRNKENSLPLIIEKTLSPDYSIMLKEHWRCTPKISNYFNKNYYKNELEIKNKTYLEGEIEYKIYKESSFQELIPRIEKKLMDEDIELSEVAIISPYKDVKVLKTNIKEYGTIHKFQGYQNKVIIFYIENRPLSNWNINKFINKKLMNVALSRAKLKFYLYIGDKVWESLQRALSKGQNELVKLVNYIDNINDPNYLINKIDENIKSEHTLTTGEHTYSFIDSVDRELYDWIQESKLNISFGCRDIDIDPQIKDIYYSEKIYDKVIYNDDGKILLIIHKDKIIFKRTNQFNSKKKIKENIELKKVKNIMTARESFWLKKIKKEMPKDSTYKSLTILSVVSFAKILNKDYKDKEHHYKMHADFVFAKRTFNEEQDRYEFNYSFLLELDDNTHNTHYKERLDNRKNLLCKDNGITLLRVKI